MNATRGRRPARSLLAAALLVLTLAAACGKGGGGDGAAGVLRETEASLRDLDSADIDFRFSGSTPPADGSGVERPAVGFVMKGPFSFESDGRLPVARLAYTRLGGDVPVTTTFLSTGDAAFVRTDEGTFTVPPDRLERLVLAKGDGDGGLDGLRLSEWFDRPRHERQGGTEVVTGAVRVDRAFADLGALAEELGATEAGALRALGDADRERLDRIVDGSSIRIVTGRDDHVLRSLDLTVDLRADVDEQAADALGQLAGATLQLSLRLADVNLPVRVEAPAGTRPLP